jgi:RNA polymerase sigma-70 factor (ECF subfamily)
VGRLVDAYRSSGGGDVPSLDDVGALESALARLVAQGRAAHPDLEVAEVAFAAHLGRCGATVAETANVPHLADLYLCCAALLGVDEAVRILWDQLREPIANSLRRIDSSPAFLGEVAQRFWGAALVGTPEAPPKLASYAGLGPLAAWASIAAQRLALTTMRHDSAERRAAVAAAAATQMASVDPELAFLKEDLRAAFKQAVERALQILDDRQRMVYRLHFVDGLTVERIAKTYGVVRQTVTRWLAETRAAIIDEVKRQLHDELRLPADEFESLARILVSQLDISVSGILIQHAS